VNVLDQDAAHAVRCVVEGMRAVAEADEDRSARSLHADSADDDALDPTAIDCLERDAGDDAVLELALFVVDDRVREGDVFESALCGCAQLEAVAACGQDAVGDDDVLCEAWLFAVGVFALEADGVISGVDGAVGDEGVLAAREIEAIGVRSEVRILDDDALDEDVVAVDGTEYF